MAGWIRLRALVIKELLVVLRDPRSRAALVGPPIVQLFVFSFAATLDVDNVRLGVVNRDAGAASEALIRRIDGSSTFTALYPLLPGEAMNTAIDRRRVIGVLHFDDGFSRDVAAGRPAEAQLVLDGRRTNAAQIVQGYLARIAADLSAELYAGATAPAAAEGPPVAVATRHWFNANLRYLWYTVPSLVGVISLLGAITVTGLSVARERELGTFEQLQVSPLRVHEILLGKMFPPVLVGVFQATLYLLAAVWVFQVPLRGSLLLLYPALLAFLASTVGIGLFISSLASTQQQAFLGSFLFLVPAILLSGFATPVENMPDWLQSATLANPLRHFLVIVKGVYLKGMPADAVLENVWPLLVIAAVTLPVAAWFFVHKRA